MSETTTGTTPAATTTVAVDATLLDLARQFAAAEAAITTAHREQGNAVARQNWAMLGEVSPERRILVAEAAIDVARTNVVSLGHQLAARVLVLAGDAA